MRFHAQFYGRRVGAIGTFGRCSQFVDGADEDAARLALYDTHEHISGLQLTPLARRWVLTAIKSDGVRTLASPAQGRYTYDTRAEAWERARAITANNTPDMVAQLIGRDLEPRLCWCWPVHFDPVGIYFDTDDTPAAVREGVQS